MRAKLRIWHLLLVTLIVALCASFWTKRETYPFASKSDAAKTNSHGAKLVALVGDQEGPYRFTGGYAESMPVDKSAPSSSRQWINYKIDGQAKIYVIPTGDAFSSHVNVFENPKGNHLLVVFERLSQ
ncbi:MAG: hypothetical protein JNK90_25005 [Planctomycetaceae bacterium]|nr:hypothetical protein [Planctomycetaceae bacterium]